jgi:hypothetical protein
MRVTITISPGCTSRRKAVQLAPVGLRPAGLLPIDRVAPGGGELGKLHLKGLPNGVPMGTGLGALVDRIDVRFGVLGHGGCPPKSANLIRIPVDPRCERRDRRDGGFTRRRRG